LYKLIVLPKRVSKEKFIKHLTEFSYIVLSVSRRDYIRLTSADLTQCTTGRITVCPINSALYDVQSLTCEAKFFFQTTGNYGPCSTSICYFPIRRQVTIRCPNGNDWRIYNGILSEAGVIHKAAACSIVSNEIRTLPELHGSAYTKLDTPSLYLPEVSPILEDHKLTQLQEAFPTEARELGNLRIRLQTPQRSYDLDTLLQLRQTPPLRKRQPHWHRIIITASCTLTVILILYCSLRARFHHSLLCNVTSDDPSDTNPVPPTTSTPTPVARHLENAEQEEYQKEMGSFATYYLPQK